MFKRLLATILALILTVSTFFTLIACNENDDPQPEGNNQSNHAHAWVAASCTQAKHCTACGMTDGMPTGHSGGNATCKQLAVCTVCGIAYGSLAEHQFTDNVCTVCGETNGTPDDKPTEGETTAKTDAELVDAAWALPIGGTLGTQTLTGVISELEAYSSQYNNRTVTIVVDGKTDKPIVAYRLKGQGIETLKVGDTIKITGELLNYKNKDGSGLVEFHSGCTFVLIQSGSSTEGDTGSNPDSGTSGTHIYTDFTSAEKDLFNDYFGFVIPFISNSEYYVEDYSDENGAYLIYYTFGNTEAEFNAYLTMFSSYTDDGVDTSDGDTWYLYSKGDVFIDIGYILYEDGYCVDVYIYIDSEAGGGETGGGETGGEGDTGNNPGTGNVGGENLPQGTNGVYDVDFTDATNVKDVTDQGYYLDGCPTVGSPGILVIPVDFSDFSASSLGYNTSVIANAFKEGGKTDYYSVYDYYYISSYGKLTPDFTVLDFWFRPQYDSEYYENQKINIDGYDTEIGDQMVLNEALAYLDTVLGWDLSQFDSDGNGTIDAVIIINAVNIDYDYNFHWAYRYWNTYSDDNGDYYEYDGVYANDYMWASYEFLFEGYDANGDVNYENTNAVNTYTYIHEFGHVLGADDYYDTTGDGSPMGGCDIMDAMAGDHNAYSKFNYGWLTTSRLVTTDTSVTLKLGDFSKNGDTIIIANNWDSTLGAYQEYYIVVYYKSTGLNGGDHGYFSRDGIVVYHVNATLFDETYEGEKYYDVYNNNSTPDGSYGTENNLIEYVLGEEENYTYVAGDSLSGVIDDNGDALAFTFTVDALDENEATITFNRVPQA